VSDITIEKLAKIYVKIRDKRRELEEQDKALKAQLGEVSALMLEICNEQGASTVRTGHGTVSVRTARNYWTSDWEAFFTFIKDNDAFYLLQKRLSSSAVQQFLDENESINLPGLNLKEEQSVVITKR